MGIAMKKYTGKSVFAGVAIGKVMLYDKGQQQVKRRKIEDAAHEVARYQEACEKAKEELAYLYDKALKEVGESGAAIFEIHQMMLDDDDYIESVNNIIETQMVNAEYAVAQTGDNFSQMFSAMDDEYMRGRAADVKDITERIINILMDSRKGGINSEEPVIVLAEDLAPSETVQMDKSKILSFVSEKGSVNSHTSILARTMGIPALIGVDIPLDESVDGHMGIVDGNNGCIYIDPDDETLEKMRKEQKKDSEKKELLLQLKGKEDVTLDGIHIKLYANIGNIKDVVNVLNNDAAGIGLFRSEFIYLERDTYPTEEEQFSIYRKVAESMAGKPVIIRTLDIGADKQAEYFNLGKEENPALGLRAIRICLQRPEIFKTQLRALYRASAYGNISIMYPMITSVSEVDRIKDIEQEVKEELSRDGISIGNPKTGIMIETPAAVMISRELAKKVDFFSIGTNDLTQYTLAIDRQNSNLDEFYDSHHPAVLEMIRMVVENAHKEGIWAGICGELGADTTLTSEFISMGVDELSVSAGKLLAIRKIIRETDTSKIKAGE